MDAKANCGGLHGTLRVSIVKQSNEFEKNWDPVDRGQPASTWWRGFANFADDFTRSRFVPWLDEDRDALAGSFRAAIDLVFIQRGGQHLRQRKIVPGPNRDLSILRKRIRSISG
jgi:hypothetical protein